MNIVLIGTGNVAFVLGKLMYNAGHTIQQVAGRNKEKTDKLSALLQAEPVYDLKTISREADIYIIAISDDALWKIGEALPIHNGIVLHTAGSVPKEVLRGLGKNYGILYPLQSLRSDRKDLPEIPFLIDADTAETLAAIRQFATTLSPLVEPADDEKRMKFHIGAVLANNFTNHLLTLTNAFCKEEQLDFKLLLPLIEETVARLRYYAPADMQTGPAIRNDEVTLQKQDKYLERYPEIRKIYELFTQSIRSFHRKV